MKKRYEVLPKTIRSFISKRYEVLPEKGIKNDTKSFFKTIRYIRIVFFLRKRKPSPKGE